MSNSGWFSKFFSQGFDSSNEGFQIFVRYFMPGLVIAFIWTALTDSSNGGFILAALFLFSLLLVGLIIHFFIKMIRINNKQKSEKRFYNLLKKLGMLFLIFFFAFCIYAVWENAFQENLFSEENEKNSIYNSVSFCRDEYSSSIDEESDIDNNVMISYFDCVLRNL